MARVWLVLLVLAALAGAASADETLAVAPPDTVVQMPRGAWVFVLPVISYSPETRFTFGATAGRSYRFSDDPRCRPSLFTPVFLVTTRSQLMLWLFGDVWWADDAWHLFGMTGYAKYPTQFYGIGDDTPATAEEEVTPGTARLDLSLARAVRPRLYLGPRVEWEHARVLQREDGGLIASGAIPGATGADICGLGLVASYDTRDALMYPTRGWFATAGASRYLDILGGDFVYTRTVVDLRRYVSLGGTRVLALQAAGTSLDHGQAPFTQLVRLGLRGYFESRYLENDGVLAQIEVRSVLWGRLGGAVFAGAGELAASRERLRLDEARYAAGFGLRVRVGPDGPERAHIRFDWGFGENDSGFYVNFGEAF
jgi:hypothetical protein